MNVSLMSFAMIMDGLKNYIDADIFCRIVKESGIQEIDLMQTEVYVYGKDALVSALKKYRIHCGCYIIAASFYSNPDAVETEIKEALEVTKEIGANNLMVVPGDMNAQDKEACEKLGKQATLELAITHYRKAVAMAKTYGIQIMFENTPQFYKPLASAEDCRTVLEQVEGLKFVFDTANFRVANKENDELVSYEQLKKWIVRFHLKDVRIVEYANGEPCVGGGAIKPVFEGSGVINMDALLQKSISDGFQGTYVIEYAAPSDTHGLGHRRSISANLEILHRMANGTKIQCPKETFKGLEKPVSKIFFGTAIRPMMFDENAQYLLDMAYAYGINAFDCARGYGNAEVVLGKWMKERQNREDVVILSKCGNTNENGEVCVNKEVIERELKESLERLQTEYIDIYLLHRDDLLTPVGEIIETLNRAKKQGKIKVFGVSNWTNERIQEANQYAHSHALDGIQVSSPNYGIARQIADPWGGGCVTISGSENTEVRKWYEKEQMPVIVYSSLGRGFFSGKFKSFDYENACRILDPIAQKGYLSADNMERLCKVEDVAAQRGSTVPQIALQYVLGSPMRIFAIVSMTKGERIYENVQAACNSMKQEDWELLNEIVKE